MHRGHLTRSREARRIAWIAGSVHTVLVGSDDTEGRLTLLRTSFRAGAASPVHVHERDDETFHILSGACVVWVGPDRWELGPGDTAFLPRMTPHAYLITADTEMLTACNPGGTEKMFQRAGWDLSEPLPDGWTVDLSSLQDASEGLGQRVLGPPITDPAATMPAALAQLDDAD